MAENTKIEWTDHTFNPFIGCTKVSPGCKNCYAENLMDTRMGKVVWGPKGERVRTSKANWNKPLQWNANHEAFFAAHGRRQRVFCASLADVFDNAVDPQWREDLFKLIEATPNLDWLLLTKRIGNVGNMLPVPFDFAKLYPHVWIGATIVNQEEADRDIPKLLAVDASVRFLSMEPLLGPVDLEHACDLAEEQICKGSWREMPDPIKCAAALRRGSVALLDWVIVGGESGPGARPMHPAWALSLRDQCVDAGVAFHFKQHGEWMPAEKDGDNVKLTFPVGGPYGPANPEFYDWPDGTVSARVGKKAAGRMLDGCTWDEFPQA